MHNQIKPFKVLWFGFLWARTEFCHLKVTAIVFHKVVFYKITQVKIYCILKWVFCRKCRWQVCSEFLMSAWSGNSGKRSLICIFLPHLITAEWGNVPRHNFKLGPNNSFKWFPVEARSRCVKIESKHSDLGCKGVMLLLLSARDFTCLVESRWLWQVILEKAFLMCMSMCKQQTQFNKSTFMLPENLKHGFLSVLFFKCHHQKLIRSKYRNVFFNARTGDIIQHILGFMLYVSSLRCSDTENDATTRRWRR